MEKNDEAKKNNARRGPMLEVDFEKFAHFLNGTDLTEDQKREKLQELWEIVLSIVAMGWGVSALDHVRFQANTHPEFSAENPTKEAEMLASSGRDVVGSGSSNSKTPHHRNTSLLDVFGEGVTS